MKSGSSLVFVHCLPIGVIFPPEFPEYIDVVWGGGEIPSLQDFHSNSQIIPNFWEGDWFENPLLVNILMAKPYFFFSPK